MLDPVTTRYAEALFNLAKARDALEAVQGDVERLSAALDSTAAAAFLGDARLPVQARRAQLSELLHGMHPLTQNLVQLLFDKRREAVLRGIGAGFRQRVLADEGRTEGVVESVRALPAGDVAELEAAVGARLGKKVHLTNRIAPELIGGVRVIAESRMLDFSLAGRLQGLRKRMLDAPLPSLQDA